MAELCSQFCLLPAESLLFDTNDGRPLASALYVQW
jgi:hypothetical protein